MIAPAGASTIQVTGSGSSERQALNNALIQAVEQTLGTFVQADSLTENFQTIKQTVLSHSRGFVSGYRVISRTETNGLFQITIDATVDEQSVSQSKDTLNTLMTMAQHPLLDVRVRTLDFDALSPYSDTMEKLLVRLKGQLRENFRFRIIGDKSTDEKTSPLKRPDYLVSLEVIKPNKHAPHGLLRLAIQDPASQQEIAKSTTDLNQGGNFYDRAEEKLFVHAAKTAQHLIDHLAQQAFSTGQEFILQFYGFPAEKLAYLPEDLSQIDGYRQHKTRHKNKKSLTLSYWSLLEAHHLQRQISQLLTGLDVTYSARLNARTLHFAFDDPVFE